MGELDNYEKTIVEWAVWHYQNDMDNRMPAGQAGWFWWGKNEFWTGKFDAFGAPSYLTIPPYASDASGIPIRYSVGIMRGLVKNGWLVTGHWRDKKEGRTGGDRPALHVRINPQILQYREVVRVKVLK